MRQLAVLGLLAVVVGLVQAADQAGTVKCKADGLHLCCTTCDTTVTAVLTKVPGVSAVKVDRKATDKVTFEAKSEKEANDALAALVKSGFCCTVNAGGKEISPTLAPVNIKGDVLVVKDVHLCCGACNSAVKALFKDATITIAGKGTQKDMTITGKNLDGQTVLDTMRKAGFTGEMQAPK